MRREPRSRETGSDSSWRDNENSRSSRSRRTKRLVASTTGVLSLRPFLNRSCSAVQTRTLTPSSRTEQCLTERVEPPMKSLESPSGAPSIVPIPNDKSRKDRLMKRRRLVAALTVSLTAVAALLISSQTVLISAQNQGQGGQNGDRKRSARTTTCLAASDPHKSTASIGPHRTKIKRPSGQGHEFRQEYIPFQE